MKQWDKQEIEIAGDAKVMHKEDCSKKIIFPKNEENLQIEPECAIVCNVTWNNDKIENIHPIAFAASNDCSIRKDGAKKISQKKNWGNSTKGFPGCSN